MVKPSPPCCFFGCKISPSKNVTLFKFPGGGSLRRKWLDAIKATGQKSSADAVCSRHFLNTDIHTVRGKARLKAAVVPSVFTNQINNKKQMQSDIADTDNQETKNSEDKSLKKDKSPEKDKSPVKDKSLENEKSPEKDKIEKNEIEKDSSFLKKVVSSKCKKTTEMEKKAEKASLVTDEEKDAAKETEKSIIEEKNNDKAATKDIKDKDVTETMDCDSRKEKDSCNKGSASDTRNELSDAKSDIEKNGINEPILGVDLSKKGRSDKDECKLVDESSQSVDSEGSQDKSCIDSTPKVPDGPRDIDKQEDIEELLTNYHIKQNNIHTVRVDEVVTIEEQDCIEYIDDVVDLPFPKEADPVFIEVSVDKDASGGAGDCLMVLESVQVDVDPSALLQAQDIEVASVDLDGDDDDDDVIPAASNGPISLLTSSDEDEVIIEEPQIDTVDVSDETDEDDMPLVKLVKKKKKLKRKQPPNQKADLGKILWGSMYEYYCVECHFRTTNRGEFSRHKKNHTRVLLMCQLCGYMTSSESQLAKHEKQHKDEKKYKCHVCDYKAKHHMSLMYHLKCHNVNKKRFKCNKCGYRSSEQSEALRHVVLCRGIDGKRHCCDKCEYRTSKASDLKRHQARKHPRSSDDDDGE